MKHNLVIAEKPSVAISIAKVIGAKNKKDGYYEGNGYKVSWCVGHLIQMANPDSYDEKYAKWNIDNLPIIPTHFFQNLTLCGAGYFMIHPSFGGGTFNKAFLNAQPALRETEYLWLVHFEHPITIKIDGRQGLGVVMKPNEQTQE